jgi:hypothetical protein
MFMDVAVWEDRTLDREIFVCGEIYCTNSVSSTTFM